MRKNKKHETRNTKQEIDIDYVAKLANLPLTQNEKKTFEKQLRQVLDYFSNLDEVNTQKVEPIGHITGLVNGAREDKPAPSLDQKEAFVNAPKTHNGFFEVEAIFEEE